MSHRRAHRLIAAHLLLPLLALTIVGCAEVADGPRAASKQPAAGSSESKGSPQPTAADQTQYDRVTTADVEETGERLLGAPPPGWRQVFQTSTAMMRMVEFVPADTPQDGWIEKVSFESLSGPDLADPIDFAIGIALDQKATCEQFGDRNTFSGLENNYETSVRLMFCSSNSLTGQGQVTLMKVIRGNDKLYVITRAKRLAVSEDASASVEDTQIALWSSYLRAIKVCDASREAHPCPESAAQTPDAQKDSDGMAITADDPA